MKQMISGEIKLMIESAWDNRALLSESKTQNAIREVIDALDKGNIRIAEPSGNDWKVNEWVKKAVILLFPYPEDGSDGSRSNGFS